MMLLRSLLRHAVAHLHGRRTPLSRERGIAAHGRGDLFNPCRSRRRRQPSLSAGFVPYSLCIRSRCAEATVANVNPAGRMQQGRSRSFSPDRPRIHSRIGQTIYFGRHRRCIHAIRLSALHCELPSPRRGGGCRRSLRQETDRNPDPRSQRKTTCPAVRAGSDDGSTVNSQDRSFRANSSRQKERLITALSVALSAVFLLIFFRDVLWILTDAQASLVSRGLSAVLLTCLFFGLFHFVNYIDNLMRSVLLYPPDGPALRGGEAASPDVGIMIPVYNEDPALVAACLAACRNVVYPRFSIYLLDDSSDAGVRAENRAACELVQATAISRTHR
ncbi:MAG: glycosyltransferase, partial [Methanobacteriota archaeon]